MNDDEHTNAEWALQYASIGWSVFPLAPRSKVPLTENGVYDASCNPEDVWKGWGEHPDANIGVACGLASGLWVLDVDCDKGGAASMQKLIEQHSHLPQTLTSWTGGNGYHRFFRYPIGRTVRNRVGVLPGIDVRSTGGYVVLPPSTHPRGARYAWEQRIPLADAPEWLYELISDPEQPEEAPWVPPAVGADLTKESRYASMAVVHACERIRAATPGQRHYQIVQEASNLGRFAAAGLLAYGYLSEVLTEAGISAGKPEAEVKRAVQAQLDWSKGYPKLPNLEDE